MRSLRTSRLLKSARTGFWHLRKGGPAQFWQWLSPRLVARGMLAPDLGPWQSEKVAAYKPLELPRYFGKIRVGVILDDFSLAAWDGEFSTVTLTPDGWREELSAAPVDLLLVESAWKGNHGAWQYKLTGPNAPAAELVELTTHCREVGIPTVFWNKEDPPHFEDFLETASLFDVVLTSDSAKIDDYKQRLGHDRVESMAFAAAPALHNPVRRGEPRQVGDVAFAGMYFAHKFPERRQQMDLLLSAAVEVGPMMENGLTIFSRFQGGDERYQFPAPFDRFVVGSLSYEKMLTAYRGFKVFLNVNSVVDSPSMCARRIFEISASGTPVVTTPSNAISSFFPADEIAVVDDPAHARWMLRGLVNSPQLRDRMVHKAQRRIWAQHTYTHRASQVLQITGVQHDPVALPPVSVMVSTNRPHQLRHVLGQVAVQKGVDLELLLLCHGFEPNHRELEEVCAELGISNYQIFAAPKQWSLGQCLNCLVSAAAGEVLAKFDDDDYYGPYYLQDQLHALRYSGAALVGKECNYLYDATLDLTIRRRPEREHRFTEFVSGPTFVGAAETFEDHPFAHRTTGEDTQFLRDLSRNGVKVYSSDRFNFLQMRHATGHTWDASAAEFLANGVVEVQGMHLNHVWC